MYRYFTNAKVLCLSPFCQVIKRRLPGRHDRRVCLARRGPKSREMAHLSPGTGFTLAVEMELYVGKRSAAAQCGSPCCQRSPNRFAIAAGRSSSTLPSGSPHTARNCCSN